MKPISYCITAATIPAGIVTILDDTTLLVYSSSISPYDRVQENNYFHSIL